MRKKGYFHYLCMKATCPECHKKVDNIELHLYGGICRECKTTANRVNAASRI